MSQIDWTTTDQKEQKDATTMKKNEQLSTRGMNNLTLLRFHCYERHSDFCSDCDVDRDESLHNCHSCLFVFKYIYSSIYYLL